MEEKIELTSPTCWKELNEQQLLYASWLLSSGNLTAEEIWTYAFIRFSNLKLKHQDEKNVIFQYKKLFFSLEPQEVLSFAKQFEFLTAGVQEIMPIEKMCGAYRSDIRLRNAPLSQYLACDNYYQAFIFKRNPLFLDRLCASFYIKGVFNDLRNEKRAKKFAKLPFHVRYTTFLWFNGLKMVLKKNFPNYFVQMERGEGETPSPPNMRKQIEQMMRALSDGDVTKIDQIYSVDTWSALAELDAKAHEYNVMKSKMKK